MIIYTINKEENILPAYLTLTTDHIANRMSENWINILTFLETYKHYSGISCAWNCSKEIYKRTKETEDLGKNVNHSNNSIIEIADNNAEHIKEACCYLIPNESFTRYL